MCPNDVELYFLLDSGQYGCDHQIAWKKERFVLKTTKICLFGLVLISMHVRTYLQAWARSCMHTCTHASAGISRHQQACVCACIHARIYRRIHEYAFAGMCACIDIDIDIDIVVDNDNDNNIDNDNDNDNDSDNETQFQCCACDKSDEQQEQDTDIVLIGWWNVELWHLQRIIHLCGDASVSDGSMACSVATLAILVSFVVTKSSDFRARLSHQHPIRCPIPLQTKNVA